MSSDSTYNQILDFFQKFIGKKVTVYLFDKTEFTGILVELHGPMLKITGCEYLIPYWSIIRFKT